MIHTKIKAQTKIRVGQTKFRNKLIKFWNNKCCITNFSKEMLTASHIKPWRHSNKKEKVEYFYSKKKEKTPTGTCLILITPDSERTMVTFLGTAGKIDQFDIDIEAVKSSEILFLEGYLWDEGEPKKAFEKAISNANKVAMSYQIYFVLKGINLTF